MDRRTSLVAPLALVATAIVGCGAAPTTPKASHEPHDALPSGPVAIAPALPTGQPGGDATAVLAAVRQARSVGKGFVADAETTETSPSGGGQQALKISYKAPSSLRIDVVKGSGLSEGAKFVWTGGTEARVKAKIVPFTLSKPITDENLVSWNGWTIAKTSPQGILDSLLDPGATCRLLGEQDVHGRRLVVVSVVSPKRPKGASHELIGIDPAVSLPASREIYQGQKLLYRLVIKRLSLTVPTASTFEI
jgi:hypothetical protein